MTENFKKIFLDTSPIIYFFDEKFYLIERATALKSTPACLDGCKRCDVCI